MTSWDKKHGSPNQWNGQMEYPPARTSHTSDWNGQMESLQMDNFPAEGFPYSRLKWTDGMTTTDSFPYFRDEDFYAFSSGTEEGGSCPTLQLNTEEDHLKID